MPFDILVTLTAAFLFVALLSGWAVLGIRWRWRPSDGACINLVSATLMRWRVRSAW